MKQSIKTLVIGGGGTANYCYMGAMREVFSENQNDRYQKSHLDSIRRLLCKTAYSKWSDLFT